VFVLDKTDLDVKIYIKNMKRIVSMEEIPLRLSRCHFALKKSKVVAGSPPPLKAGGVLAD
jgi:hypothetical protein